MKLIPVTLRPQETKLIDFYPRLKWGSFMLCTDALWNPHYSKINTVTYDVNSRCFLRVHREVVAGGYWYGHAVPRAHVPVCRHRPSAPGAALQGKDNDIYFTQLCHVNFGKLVKFFLGTQNIWYGWYGTMVLVPFSWIYQNKDYPEPSLWSTF